MKKLIQDNINISNFYPGDYSPARLREMADKMEENNIVNLSIEKEYGYEHECYLNFVFSREETDEEEAARLVKEEAQKERVAKDNLNILKKRIKEMGLTAKDLGL